MENYSVSYDYDFSNDSYSFVEPCMRDEDNMLGARLSVLYYFMSVFSFLGNGLVLFIIYRFERLTTVTNILLLNLVLSSLVFMSSLPFVGVYMQLSDWIFGRAVCKVVGSVYYLGFYSSILFLTLLTFDRHLTVVYSLETSRVRNRSYAVLSCGVVWLVSGLACIRPMILQKTVFNHLEQKTLCEQNMSEEPTVRTLGVLLHLLLFLIFPLVVIVYCYIRIAITVMSTQLSAKFKTVRLIFVIVVLFVTCWTPFNVVLLVHESAPTFNCEETQKLGYALQITRTITYFYFCISPVFYTFVGRKFQKHFRQLMISHFPSKRRGQVASQSSRFNTSTKLTPTIDPVEPKNQ
ncbi:unnamed protein product [Ophioblennius macclurei]